MYIKINLLDKTEIMRYRHNMDFYRARFTIRQTVLVIIVLAQAFFASGCNGKSISFFCR